MSGGRQMGRKAADQGVDGRQAMWLAIKACPAGKISVSEIVARAKVNRSTALRYLKALTASGHLEFTAGAPGQPGSWHLKQDVGHHAPRIRADGSKVTQGEVCEQLWRAMYMLKVFTFNDLIQHATIEIPEATAKDYCKRLLAAGYLGVLRKANPAASQVASYRLIRHSGPKSPQVQRVRQIFDPNTGAVYSLGERA